MSATFSFRGSLGDQGLETAFVFLAERELSPDIVEQALRRVLREDQISPDLVCYFSDEPLSGLHEAVLRSDFLNDRHSALKRCRGVLFACFDGSGAEGSLIWLRGPSGDPFHLNSNTVLAAARLCGLSTLSRRDGVVTVAPPGTYFLNPSQGRRSYFIRSGMMCLTSSEATFVAFCLLPFISKLRDQYGTAPNIIWVDTVSIAYLAYALIALGTRLGLFVSPPQIRSFSSYAGIRRTLPATGEFPAFIVSASTSGALARDLIEFHEGRVPSGAVCTIVGAFDSPFPELLYRLTPDQEGPKLTSFDTLREIRVRGEDFLFNPGEPQSVELRLPQLPSSFPVEFARIQGKGIVRYWRRASGNKQPKPLLIDARKLIKDAEFRAWVIAKSRGFLPLSTARVVYQNDDPSHEMADMVVAAITPFCRHSVVAVSSSDLEKLPPNIDETVAVVATAVGSGMELMQLTRALRHFQPNGSRYFMVGAFSARRATQLLQLQSNIRKSDPKLSYSLTAWCAFAPGIDGLAQFRLREMELMQGIRASDTPIAEVTREFAESRMQDLGKEGIVREGESHERPFIALTDNPAAFDVGKGFAPWKEFTECRCSTDVLFTVACWLQNAREDKELRSDHRLDDGGFQQTVLSPEFLLRFTDPVIQTAIFRCAYDSELDYRSSPAISARCGEILAKIIHRREEAAIEIILALALGRIRLRADDRKRVREVAQLSLSEHPLTQRLLGAIV